MDITQEYLREWYDYNSDTGQLVYKKPTARTHPYMIGRPIAGTIAKGTGYLVFSITRAPFKRQYRLHRLIWIWHNGPIPADRMIDHIDRNKLNNRIENLRLVDHRENSLNQSLTPRNKSGYAGINLRKRGGRPLYYEAVILHHGKFHYLGQWKTFEEAFAARFAAEKVLGFHPNHCKSTKLQANPHMVTSKPKSYDRHARLNPDYVAAKGGN